MKQIKKIFVWLILLNSILYGGIVWTGPIPNKGLDIEVHTSTDDNHGPYYLIQAGKQLHLFPIRNGGIYSHKISVEPVILFLFGSGILGFFIMAKRRL